MTISEIPLSGPLWRAFGAATVLAFLATPPVCAADDVSHEVRQGENPWTISTRYLRSMALWPRLVTYNRIPDALRIAPGTILRIPEAWLARRRLPATVLAVNGDVLLTDAQGRQTRLKTGDTLPEGAVLKTGAQQNLSLGLLDNSRVLVRSDSELRLESNAEIALDRTRSILLDLRHGALESEVTKRSSSGGRFEIRTPAGTAAVRGTSFRVTAGDTKTSTEVLAGAVSLGNRAGMVDLATGYATTVAPQGAPEPPRALLSAPDLAGLPACRGASSASRPTCPSRNWPAPPPTARSWPVTNGSTLCSPTRPRQRRWPACATCPTASICCACAASTRPGSKVSTPAID